MHILFDERTGYERGKTKKEANLRIMDTKIIRTMLAILYYGRTRDDVTTVQRIAAKEQKNF